MDTTLLALQKFHYPIMHKHINANVVVYNLKKNNNQQLRLRKKGKQDQVLFMVYKV